MKEAKQADDVLTERDEQDVVSSENDGQTCLDTLTREEYWHGQYKYENCESAREKENQQMSEDEEAVAHKPYGEPNVGLRYPPSRYHHAS
ncbi:hypothetical protein G6F42_026473 [Rhizopus arrhizus]|nr:hypothetical protein G6F42_026473 [Rhizopus arrhizus]